MWKLGMARPFPSTGPTIGSVTSAHTWLLKAGAAQVLMEGGFGRWGAKIH